MVPHKLVFECFCLSLENGWSRSEGGRKRRGAAVGLTSAAASRPCFFCILLSLFAISSRYNDKHKGYLECALPTCEAERCRPARSLSSETAS